MADTSAAASILNVGLAPVMAMGMTHMMMADSIGLVMANASANQQRGQVLAAAALAQVLAMILAEGSKPPAGG
ncbi:RebB family R body protein [Azospirillum sp. B4]|uniref:RebB family R body protein n=1 Tax=Azospirillum sp. B4 TaxID=95605 RepID=UPI000345E008|nr:RebB family R body protein [Azospirillum sp. B4]